jgi:hypothetical protein
MLLHPGRIPINRCLWAALATWAAREREYLARDARELVRFGQRVRAGRSKHTRRRDTPIVTKMLTTTLGSRERAFQHALTRWASVPTYREWCARGYVELAVEDTESAAWMAELDETRRNG